MSHHRRSRDRIRIRYFNPCESPPSAVSSPQIEPCLHGYQLIGDRQFLRLSQQLLYKSCKQMNGISSLGLCLRKQTIGELLRHVRDNSNGGCLSDKVVLMIGTNDLLHDTSHKDMCKNVDSLVEQLRVKGVRRIILLTIPPVPRLAEDGSHWYRLRKYNDHILRWHDGKSVIVINAYAKFVEPKRRAVTSCLKFAHRSEGRGKGISPISNSQYDGIRISIGEERRSRQVYVLDQASQPPLRSQHSDGDSLTNSSAQLRGCLKKRSGGVKRPLDDDRHNRDMQSQHAVALRSADCVLEQYFEEYFGENRNRKDGIHLNDLGLRIVLRLVLNAMDERSTSRDYRNVDDGDD